MRNLDTIFTALEITTVAATANLHRNGITRYPAEIPNAFSSDWGYHMHSTEKTHVASVSTWGGKASQCLAQCMPTK